jgi:[ribosomal protein S5]-alanine N-acetyltransferase
MYPVELHGQQVILREFTCADLADSLQIVGDDAVTSWLSFDSRSEDEARAMLDGIVARARQQPRAEYYLAIALPADKTVIGFARLGLADVRAAKLGFAIRRSHWGHGYATDAARTLITFGFGELGLHRISAAAGPGNAASIAVIKRLGLTYEGRIRDHVFTNGAWRDSLLYSLLASEWASERQAVAGTASPTRLARSASASSSPRDRTTADRPRSGGRQRSYRDPRCHPRHISSTPRS